EVRRKEQRLLAIRHTHRLRPAGVSLDPVEAHTRNDLDRLVDELELARRLERGEVVDQIATARALVRRVRIEPLEALEDVRRARERRDDTVAVAIRVSTGVVVVQMCVDDERHLVWTHAPCGKLLEQTRRTVD